MYKFSSRKKERDQAIKIEEKLVVQNILIWETRGTSLVVEKVPKKLLQISKLLKDESSINQNTNKPVLLELIM